MNTIFIKQKKISARLYITLIVLTVSLISPITLTFANDFEFGTQFGISRFTPDDGDSTASITYSQFPSAIMSFGTTPTLLYATWFPTDMFAIGPEFSYGRVSISEEIWGEENTSNITSIYMGGRVSFYILGHSTSSPYLFGHVSQTILSGDETFIFDSDETLSNIGFGVGYQWRVGSAIVLRAEGHYHRIFFDEENANEYSLTFRIGNRFGK